MTQEDKELLMRDLSTRIPYGVIVNVYGMPNVKLTSVSWYGEVGVNDDSTYLYPISEVKPYLFPLLSMTDIQKKEYNILRDDAQTYHYEFGDIIEDTLLYDNWESIDYLNAHHFDYRGLIEKGLAIDATGLNIY